MTDFSLTSFSVRSLYGDRDISVPIRDNKLVIVGVNGLGKSTFINLMYYFISRQWAKLLDYSFQSISATVNGRELTISREELETPSFSNLSPDIDINLRLTSRARAAMDKILLNPAQSMIAIEQARSLPAFMDSMRYQFPNLLPSDIRLLRNVFVHSSATGLANENLREIRAYLGEALSAQILYLPTYRRIEKDLNLIFPGLEDEMRNFQQQRRRVRAEAELSFIELVEFGMEDVKRIIDTKLSEQSEAARSELNNLAGGYLRDVLRGQGEEYDSELVSTLTNEDIEDILNRVEEQTLSDDDKNNLRQVINTIRDRGNLNPNDRYVAHFFVKLVIARQKLKDRQVSITRLVDVCNKYLDGKRLTYDDVKYTLRVMRQGQTIDYAALSSGEKQILSLMSQVFIGSASEYAVFIDEPELSLSVSWQERLLPDLHASGHCQFIAAVTHSPFIFDNSFNEYTIDLGDYVTESASDVS
jgi:energy-coupling factor transporter ATP-binding protein EcfA2